MSDVSPATRALNAYIAAVETADAAAARALKDGTMLDPAVLAEMKAFDRQCISEWTSARLAVEQVIPDWSVRIKTGFFQKSERSQRAELAQEAVALIERSEDHASWSDAARAPLLDPDTLHPWVWEAARAAWASGLYRHAVSDAVEAVTGKLKQRVGYTGKSTPAYQDAFAESAPTPGHPRLHLTAKDSSETWKNSQRGVILLGQACVAGLRNASIAHGVTAPVSRQEALEQLATVSLLARWVEQATLVEHDPTL